MRSHEPGMHVVNIANRRDVLFKRSAQVCDVEVVR